MNLPDYIPNNDLQQRALLFPRNYQSKYLLMELTITEIQGTSFAVLEANTIKITTAQDALDLIGNSGYLGADKVVIQKEHLHPSFFDLKTGLAGEVLQKFSNYRMQLAIVGDFSDFTSKSLRDFIYESNKQGRINFVESFEEAQEKLVKCV
ncbi:MAG: DUF4180 domain-containing protein [Rufibacter sp.]